MYLCQQLQSFLLGDALQFHPIRSFSIQDVVNELVQSRPAGYALCPFLLLGKLSYLEGSDGVLRPCQSLWLDGEDQRHFLCHGNGCLRGKGLAPCRSRLSHGRLGVYGNSFTGGSRGLGGGVLAGA